MISTPFSRFLWLVCLASALGAFPCRAQEPSFLSEIRLPPGFRISVFASGVPDARSMALSPKGIVFVGSRQAGRVYAVVDADRNGKADRVIVLASGLRQPNGAAFRGSSLYVAEINRILRFDDIEDKLDRPPPPAVLDESYPDREAHGWKFIAFGPDGKLYVPVGAPCNVCLPGDPFASITRLNLATGERETVARGVRNTVGFDWHPETRELWFTDNGRDWAGDNLPPDELNRLEKTGGHFGFPYCHGFSFSDPQFGSGHPCRNYIPPVKELGPHVAALGMRFYTGALFPEKYRGQIFIVEHGSWNRSQKTGYRVSLVTLQGNRAMNYEPFAEGWLTKNGQVRGRPVDILVMPDGALLVSDDHAGMIYRISYSSKN